MSDDLRCVCASEDGTVRCRQGRTKDDGLCDWCRAAKEKQ
jgi:hypothetical protein